MLISFDSLKPKFDCSATINHSLESWDPDKPTHNLRHRRSKLEKNTNLNWNLFSLPRSFLWLLSTLNTIFLRRSSTHWKKWPRKNLLVLRPSKSLYLTHNLKYWRSKIRKKINWNSFSLPHSFGLLLLTLNTIFRDIRPHIWKLWSRQTF